MKNGFTLADLDTIPRLGWIGSASPVTDEPDLARELGLDFVGFKRDDLLEALFGGTKARKLDCLLAAEPFVSASTWVAMGAIGSGNTVALAAAAEREGRKVDAHAFWTMVSKGVLENLALAASGPTTINYYRSRTDLALRRPTLFLSDKLHGNPVVPPGSSNGVGMIGMVRAGLELGDQIRAGVVPRPDRIYVAFGSGGTAVGLRAGLALSGIDTTVVAVVVVERVLAGALRVRMLEGMLARELRRFDIEIPRGGAKLLLEYAQVGLGYAIPTAGSIEACERFASAGIALEPIYSGKAMASFLAGVKKSGARNVLVWLTAHGTAPLPAKDWLSRLPPTLERRVRAELADEHRDTMAKVAAIRTSRRRWMISSLAGGVALAVGIRCTGYPLLEGWNGAVLAAWEAHVIRCAAEAVLPRGLEPSSLTEIARCVDRYLEKLPESTLREAHAMFVMIEHASPVMGAHVRRFTNLDVDEREIVLLRLEARGGLSSLASRSLRDLCMVGHYQHPSTWKDLGYEGPLLPMEADPRGPSRMVWPGYDALVARPGELPKGIIS